MNEPSSLHASDAFVVNGVELVTVDSSELRVGDIVHTHGLKVKLNRHPHIFKGNGDRMVFSFVGDVLNAEEAIAKGFPRGFLCENRWVDGVGWVPTRTDMWTVQGNDLAMWAVERSA